MREKVDNKVREQKWTSLFYLCVCVCECSGCDDERRLCLYIVLGNVAEAVELTIRSC